MELGFTLAHQLGETVQVGRMTATGGKVESEELAAGDLYLLVVFSVSDYSNGTSAGPVGSWSWLLVGFAS
jgi:hypothetical protein